LPQGLRNNQRNRRNRFNTPPASWTIASRVHDALSINDLTRVTLEPPTKPTTINIFPLARDLQQNFPEIFTISKGMGRAPH
jgi:hypothetical protein